MKFILKTGAAFEVSEVLGIVPARVRYKDADGVEREVKENDLQQIEPALTESLKELVAS